MTARPLLASATLAALLAIALAAARPAGAEPKPKKEGPPDKVVPSQTAPTILIGSGSGGGIVIPWNDTEEADEDSVLSGLPRTYRALVKRFGTMSPSDSIGDGLYQAADAAFTAGKFEDASKGYVDFARRFPRNLHVNDALSMTLLIKDARDFEDQPLLLYARARAAREVGKDGDATAILTTAAQRYPGAKVRHHVSLLLAEIAQEKGDHASALQWAVAAADTSKGNRLAPYALKIAAESSLAMGEAPQKALGFYKTILERYPDSPVTPQARNRALAIRKKMPG